jgi:hypothetical protein
MAASDWDADPANNGDVTFPDIGGGDHAMLLNLYPSGSPTIDTVTFLQKTHTSMKNTELEFKYNLASENMNDYFCPLLLRWDRAQQAGGNGYRFYLRKFWNSGWWFAIAIYKVINGTPTVLVASPQLISWAMGVWRRVRVRCWDLVFPAGAVRFTVEYFDGANWITLYTYTDVTGAFFNTLGRAGFGGVGGPGIINQYLYFNDMYVRW